MKQKIWFVIRLLFGLMFINSGLNKLFNYLPVPDDLPADLVRVSAAMAEIAWLMPLVAVVEIAGGLLFIFKRTEALGAIIIFPVMTGILFTHLFYMKAGLPMVILLLAINLFSIICNRRKYLHMVQS